MVESGDISIADAKIKSPGLRETIVDAGHVSEYGLIHPNGWCSFLVIASLKESFELSVVDAIAAGKPAIVLYSAGLPEIVREMENGFIYESGDSRGLSDAIFRLWNDTELARSMGERNAERQGLCVPGQQ